MPTSKLSQIIQYYRQCFQASFHSSEGHGIFDRDDVIPLEISIGSSSDAIKLTEGQLSAWLVDSDQTELVLFDGFMLYPTPNRSYTTEVHYSPIGSVTTASLISKRLKQTSVEAEPHLFKMMQSIDIDALNENSASYDDLLVEATGPLHSVETEQCPEPKKLNRWLVKQAKLIKSPVQIKIQVLALVPKDLRSYRAKEAFVGHLDDLAQDAQDPAAHPLLSRLLQRNSKRSSIGRKYRLVKQRCGLRVW